MGFIRAAFAAQCSHEPGSQSRMCSHFSTSSPAADLRCVQRRSAASNVWQESAHDRSNHFSRLCSHFSTLSSAAHNCEFGCLLLCQSGRAGHSVDAGKKIGDTVEPPSNRLEAGDALKPQRQLGVHPIVSPDGLLQDDLAEGAAGAGAAGVRLCRRQLGALLPQLLQQLQRQAAPRACRC